MADLNSNIDHHVVIASMPLVDSMHAPMAAPAVLKASLNKAGIQSTAMDLNIEVLVKLKSHPEYNNLKKFFDSQMAEDWVVQETKKYNINIVLMIITGYPTETLEDYEYTKQWFKDRVQYNNTIRRLFLTPLTILPGTGLERNISKYGIIVSEENRRIWQTAEISKSARLEHHQSLVDLCKNKLKFNLDAY